MNESALTELHSQAQAADATTVQADATSPAPDAVPTGAPGAPPAMDPVTEMFTALTIAVAMLGQALPYLPTIYTEATLRGIAAAMVSVATKYGWDTSGFFSRYAPELMLAASILPTIPAVTRAHRAWVADQQARAADAGQAAPADAGQPAAPVPAGA